MNKEKFLKLIAAKEARKAEITKVAETCEDTAELIKMSTELEGLNEEIRSLNEILTPIVSERTAAVNGEIPGVVAASAKATEGRKEDAISKLEKRGDDLKAKRTVEFALEELPEFRTVTVTSSNLVVPTQYSSTLNPAFNQVSGLIDLVNAVPLTGGESYEKGFEVSIGEGGYTAETGEYTEADPTFGYVSITKAKITAYAELSDEAMKLPSINYQAWVADSIGKALRKKITRQIVSGAGGANAITGIFNAPTNVIPTATDIAVSEIDADTLDNIVLGFGGDEDIEGGGYLILSKTDLAAFAKVRGSDGKKLYKIVLNGNSGTISSDDSYSVNFIINSACTAVEDAEVGVYCMAYGMAKGYEMPVFSQITVEESRDYKFRTGQIAYRGSVWAGGNVAMYKGFVRVKKGA